MKECDDPHAQSSAPCVTVVCRPRHGLAQGRRGGMSVQTHRRYASGTPLSRDHDARARHYYEVSGLRSEATDTAAPAGVNRHAEW